MHSRAVSGQYRGSRQRRICPSGCGVSLVCSASEQNYILERSFPHHKVPVWLNAAHAMLLTSKQRIPNII